MKDYLEHRQYVIHELPKAEVNEKIVEFTLGSDPIKYR